MAGADFAIKFSDWSGGDSGIDDTNRPSANTYKGRNVVQYRSGLLGPRPGWKFRGNTSFTGLLVFFDSLSGATAGAPGAVFVAASFAGSDNYVYALNSSGATIASRTTVGGGQLTGQGVTINNDLYIISASAATVPTGLRRYRYTPSGPSVSTPTTITLPEVIRHVAYAGLFLVGVSHASPWRIYHSELSPSGPTYTSWPANNFYDVGDTVQPITALHWVGNVLYVGKRNGWWSVTGVLGEQVTIRQVSSDPGPKAWGYSAVRADGRISYVSPDGYAAMFNGERAQVDRTRQYFEWPTTTLDEFLRLREGPRVVPLPGTGGALMVATRDTLPLGALSNVSHQVVDQRGWAGHSGSQVHVSTNVYAPRDLESFVDPTGVAFALANQGNQLASWNYLLDRPARVSDEWGAPLEYVTPGGASPGLVSGEVLFPAWFDSQGRQVRVKSVIIQFRKWTSGVADSMNRLDCQIVRAGAYEGGESVSEVQTWTEASASATDDGVDDSVRFGFGDQGFGNGFRIKIPVMQGVAIREIVALVDIRTAKT